MKLFQRMRHVASALASISLLLPAVASQARDNGQYAQVSRDIKVWIEGLTDEQGVGCCATADGVRPKEVEWDISANSYRVKVKGQWVHVPDEAVVKSPNRLGHAVVWLWFDADIHSGEVYPVIRCFLPGAAS